MAKSPYARYGQTALTGTQASAIRHTVRAGEELPAIAALEYGQGYDQELWRGIAEDDENDITDLDADVTAGTVLVIPPAAAATT